MDIDDLNAQLKEIAGGQVKGGTFHAKLAPKTEAKASLDGDFLKVNQYTEGQLIFYFGDDELATIDTVEGTKCLKFLTDLAYFDSEGAKLMSQFLAIVSKVLEQEEADDND